MDIDKTLDYLQKEKNKILNKLNKLDIRISKYESLKLNYVGIKEELSEGMYYVPSMLAKCNKLSTNNGVAYYYFLDNGNKIVGNYYKLYDSKYVYDYHNKTGLFEILILDYEKGIPNHFDKKKINLKLKKYIGKSLNNHRYGIKISEKSHNRDLFEDLLLFK